MNTTPIIEWYSFAEGVKYLGNEPAFFDINHLPWKKVLEDNYLHFLEELKLLIEKNDDQIIPYYNETLASSKNNWTIFPLMVWGKKNQENCTKCPTTYEIIQSIEGVTSCAFSMLKPHTSIKPHLGDSNVMYRVHVTLESKGQLPEMGMRVKDKTIDWKNGEVFAFCDAHEHEVWNNTDTNRYILIIDILREPFIHKKKQICAKINATLFWQLKFQRFYFIKHLPKFIRRAMMNTTAFFIHKK